MQQGRLSIILMCAILIMLCIIAVELHQNPQSVQAQETAPYPLFLDPGTRMIRSPDGGQMLGKIAVDLRTGKIWGFPTWNPDPYPVNPALGTNSKPPTSHPIALGRFALEDIDK